MIKISYNTLEIIIEVIFFFFYRLAPFNDIPDNSDLRNAVIMFEGESIGPEGFAVDGDGNMYTGLADGRVVRFNDTDITTVLRLGLPPYDRCGKNVFDISPNISLAISLAISLTISLALAISFAISLAIRCTLMRELK